MKNKNILRLLLSTSVLAFSACSAQLTGSAELAAAASEAIASSSGNATLSIGTSSIANTAVGGTSAPVTFTVTHSGSASARITARSMSLGGSSPFTITGGTCSVSATITSGGSCTLIVTFSPTTAGSLRDTLNLGYTVGSTSKTATLSISGNGRNPAVLTITSNPFATTTISYTSATSYQTVTNIGGVPATITSAGFISTLFRTVAGTILGGDCVAMGTLPPGSSCTVGVKFTPDENAVVGLNTAPLVVDYNDGAAPRSVSRNLSGTATTPPGALRISGGTFGSTIAGNTETVTYTVTNYGTQDATSLSVLHMGPDPQFAVSAETCTGATLVPAATCTIDITFTPAGHSNASSVFRIGYHNSIIWNYLDTTKTAVGLAPATFGITGSIPYSLPVTVFGATSTPATLTVTNSGDLSGTFTGISVGTAPFSITGGTCAVSGTLAPAGTCTIIMTFTPPSTGVQSDTLTLDYTNGVGPTTATHALSGTGLSPALLVIGTGKFSHPTVGATSSPITFTVSNGSDSPATIISRSLTTGTQFAITGGTCSAAATVAAYGSCTIIVTFSPTSTGTKTDTINISYNNGVTTTSATRAISSTTPIPALLEIGTGSFANTSSGNTSAPVTFTVSNEGDTIATISARSLAAGGASEFAITGGTCTASATVAPLATCTLILTFSPTSGGEKTDTINLDYNDTVTSQTATLAITGTAPSPLRTIAAGTSHSCRIVSGVLQCWGHDGVTNYGSSAVTVDSGTSYKHVTVGFNHSCGVTVAGVLKCWGANGSGQLGGGGATEATPITIDSGTSYAVVSAGQIHTCGVTAGGDLKCWGEGNVGQLGNGGSASASPTLIDSGVSYTDVSAGGYHTCGIVTDGSMKCFGTDYVGESGGQGLIGSEIFPILAMSGIETAGIGPYHSCGISGGSLYCVGYNASGQLGIGGILDQYTPVAVDSGTLFLKLDAGGDSDGFTAFDTCAITTAGILKCAGSLNGADVMTVVDSGVSYSEVSVGDFHACGITTGGVTKCWGANASGQLGNGSTTPSATPVIAP